MTQSFLNKAQAHARRSRENNGRDETLVLNARTRVKEPECIHGHGRKERKRDKKNEE